MILDVIQTQKEFYSAFFEIRSNLISGEMELQGDMGSMEGRWTIDLPKCHGRMFRTTSKPEKSAYRPYSVELNHNTVGVVWQAEQKVGFLKNWVVVRMTLLGENYSMYPLSFGEEGGKSPIFCSDLQIAQIDHSSVCYNDLHNYRLYCLDDASVLIAVLLCAFMYVVGPYKPGQKVHGGVSKTYGRTNDKLLLAKYDPGFILNC